MIYVNELWKLGIIMTSLRLPEKKEDIVVFGAGFGKFVLFGDQLLSTLIIVSYC